MSKGKKKVSSWITATSDYMVRVLLGQEDNIPVLRDFINAVLEDRGLPLLDHLVLKNPINMKDVFDSKESNLDVKAQDEAGHIYDVEIQTTREPDYLERSLYYWSKLFSSQLKEGEKYGTLNPVICINLLKKIQFDYKTDDNPHSFFMIKDLDSNALLSDMLQMHFLELERVTSHLDRKPITRLEKWLWYFIMEGEVEEENMGNILDDYIFVKTHSTFKQFTASDELREKYEARMKWKRDQAWKMDNDLRRAREKGMAQGLEEGLEQGLEQGRSEAVQGLARKMKDENVSVETIVAVSGLTRDEIEQL